LKKKIKKILIANRGEIALRVIRSAKELGIKTVAVYSEVDRRSLHVLHADEAIPLGPAPSRDSYLNMKKILDAARKTNADAIHPGYGFLSENAAFAKAVEEAGFIWIGPSSRSIKIMGDKIAAKKAVSRYKIPQVPGSNGIIRNKKEAREVARKIGFPVLIKASAGGGGKGMRIVEDIKDFDSHLERAQSEAQSAFGDSSVFIEKFVSSPRHIEFQILGDLHGNIIHFFERECSIQRRHQKVIEEAPSSVLDEDLRERMGKAAVDVARSVNYAGAGTVEFILDESHNFYFLEMNTRLQVEHPVTEMITGVDLVKQQIFVAEGEKLKIKQQDLKILGHAIEARVYAEDPENSFLPDIGKLLTYRRPQGIGVRVDDAFEEGMDIPIHYDPMIAKLIAFAGNREEAIERMIRAIDEYLVTGVSTTLNFCKFVMQHRAFRSGNFDTNFVPKYFKPDNNHSAQQDDLETTAAFLNWFKKKKIAGNTNSVAPGKKDWRRRLKK